MVNELLRIWPQCRIVHGKPRHSQSQGSLERANADIEASRFLLWILKGIKLEAKVLPQNYLIFDIGEHDINIIFAI